MPGSKGNPPAPAKAAQELKLDLQISAVRNAEEAIAYLLGQGEFADRSFHPPPDLVLAELQMPIADGFFPLNWRNSTPAFSTLPVFALTESLNPKDTQRAVQLGVDAVFLKPMSFDGRLQTAQEVYHRALRTLSHKLPLFAA